MDAAGIITIMWPKKNSWFSFTNLFSPELCPPNSFTVFHARTLSYLWVFSFFSPVFFFFFFVDHFLKSLYWICYNITSASCFGFLTSGHVGSWFLDQGSNLQPPALEGKVPTTGPLGKADFFFLPPSRSNWPQSPLDFPFKHIQNFPFLIISSFPP